MLDESTREMLRKSLTLVLSDSDGPIRDKLDDLGWDEVIADDPIPALRLLFDVKGTTLSSADALGPLLAGTIAARIGRPDLATAAVIVLVQLRSGHPVALLEAGRLDLIGLATAEPEPGCAVVVPVEQGASFSFALVPCDALRTVAAVSGADSSIGFEVRATVPTSAIEWIGGAIAHDAWEAAVTAARWALAVELNAIGRSVIADAVAYTSQRQQYGRPIGTFQALQHRLAAAWASVVGAGEVANEASESSKSWDAMVAKALAGRAAENACTQAQQSYGAIGFTWEHGFHRRLRRVYVLDRLFGDWRSLELEIGSRLVSAKAVAKIGQL